MATLGILPPVPHCHCRELFCHPALNLRYCRIFIPHMPPELHCMGDTVSGISIQNNNLSCTSPLVSYCTAWYAPDICTVCIHNIFRSLALAPYDDLMLLQCCVCYRYCNVLQSLRSYPLQICSEYISHQACAVDDCTTHYCLLYSTFHYLQ